LVKAVRFHELGGPDVLKVEDVEIGNPGAGEILVDVKAIGLNRAETMFRMGTYVDKPNLPSGIGYEGSGIVGSLGEGVTGVRPGDKVSIMPTFGLNAYSVYAEKAIVPISSIVPLAAGFSLEEGAAIWMANLTAYGALIQAGALTEGDFAIVTAASSSVGLAAIQLAKMAGATPIAATRTGAKRDALLKAGAPHVIATGEQDLVAEVARITGGKGARVIFDPVGGPYLDTLVRAAGDNGQIYVYGGLSGQPSPFPLFGAPPPDARIPERGVTLRFYTLREVTTDPAKMATCVAYIQSGLASGALKPIIAKTFPLADVVAAHRYMESNQQFGKIVLTV
jgi:NADPH:quinone reductase-like Zn-dependent oxidoreductase